MEQELSTTQTPAPTEAPKAKGKAGAIIITAIVAFALGIGAFFLINTLTNKSDDTDNPTGETVTAKNANDVIADAKELIRRTNLIFFLFDDESDQLSIYKTPRYSSLSELNELSLDAKATIARGTLVDDKFVTNWETMTKDELTELQKAMGVDVKEDPLTFDFYRVSRNFDITPIAEEYKKLFGEELDLENNKVIRLDYTYPGMDYIYVVSNKTLYSGGGGGEVSTVSYTYINDIKFDGDDAYVYFNVFNSDMTEYDLTSGEVQTENETCYDGIGRTNTFKCNSKNDILYGGIKSSNYKGLKNYRLKFHLEDGNYIYKGAEEVK